MALLPWGEQRGDNRAAANEGREGERRQRTQLRENPAFHHYSVRLLARESATDVIIPHISGRTDLPCSVKKNDP